MLARRSSGRTAAAYSAAVIIGRLGNALGLLAASVFIAASEALTMAVTAPGWAPLVSFTLLIVILLLRPEL